MRLYSYIKLLRPVQWLKNLMLFFPPFLGGILFQDGTLRHGILPFTTFCLASSATYVLNDISDINRDKEHPIKKERPLSSGRITILQAYPIAILLYLVSLVMAYYVSGTFLLFLAAYLVISLSYSFLLKDYPVIDIFCIASGFLIRLMAGGSAFKVNISEWLFLSVFLLALFLSTGKRLGEKAILLESANNHRRVLSSYPDGFLDTLLYITGSAVLVTYTMYVLNRHSSFLLYTVPLCCFGLMRYILRIKTGKGGDPTESLTRDLPLFFTGLTWTIMVGCGIYAG